jgi:hypothetical protein
MRMAVIPLPESDKEVVYRSDFRFNFLIFQYRVP